jgi:transposase
MRTVLKTQINKTDRNDASGIAQMMRVGLCRSAHVETLRGQKLRMLLTHRKLLQSKALAVENDLRGECWLSSCPLASKDVAAELGLREHTVAE